MTMSPARSVADYQWPYPGDANQRLVKPIPLGELFLWEKTLFLWPFSIAMLMMNHDERMDGTGTYFSENNTLGYINLGHFRGGQIVSVPGQSLIIFGS